jgi:hypothetical protein
MSAPPDSPSQTDAPPELEWRVCLATRQPARAVATVLVVLAAAGWAWYLFGSPVAAGVTAGLLLGAVGDFLFPVRYRLTAEGAEARGLFSWRRIAWTEVKRVYVAEQEIKLSPLAHAGPRESFRGVVLRCAANREAVLDAVRQLRAACARPDLPDAPSGSRPDA